MYLPFFYCAIVPIKGKTESDFALGFIECMSKMGGSPQVIMTDGEGAIKNSGLCFQIFHGTSYHIHTVQRSSSVPRKDGHNFQGDVRQADQARRTLDRLDISNIIILY